VYFPAVPGHGEVRKSDSKSAKLVWEQRRQASSKSILAMSELVNLIVNKITAKLN
jgi:hypothetical protein